MKKSLLILILFCTFLEANTIYERILEKSFFSGDLKKAKSMINKGANITTIDESIWYNNPSYKQVKFLVENGYPLKSLNRCILEDILYQKRSPKDLFRKTKLLVENGVDMTCTDVNPQYHKRPLIFKVVTITRAKKEFLTPERKKTVLYIIKQMNSKQINDFFQNNEYHLNGDFDHVISYTKPLNMLDFDNTKFNREVFKALIKKGTHINEPIWMNADKTEKYFPINKAISMGSVDLVKFCLKQKADPYILYKERRKNYNAIDYAHLKGKDDIEIYLLEAGINYHYYSELNPYKKGDRIELKGRVIIDHKNNLVWQKGSSGKMRLQDAKNYCKKLSLQGYSNWRLPTMKEYEILSGVADKFMTDDIFYFTSTLKDKGEKFYGATLPPHSKNVKGYWINTYVNKYVKCVSEKK